MSLYNPPLRLSKSEEWNTASSITNALGVFNIDYFYTGKRLGKELIELSVCTVVEDAEDNLFLRHCQYSGKKENWKEVIEEQLKSQLRDLGIDEGFVKAEMRYWEVEGEKHCKKEILENRKRELIHQISTKNF